MATAAMIALETVTLATTATSVTFSNIPTDGTYRDLYLVFSGAGSSSENMQLTFNSNTSNYTQNGFLDNASPPGAYNSTGVNFGSIGTGETFMKAEIMDYASTDKYTTVLARTEQGSSLRYMTIRWGELTAINEITISIFRGYNFTSGSYFGLFGIKGEI